MQLNFVSDCFTVILQFTNTRTLRKTKNGERGIVNFSHAIIGSVGVNSNATMTSDRTVHSEGCRQSTQQVEIFSSSKFVAHSSQACRR